MEAPKLPLRDIHLPEPIGWWPPAPGWWLLAVLIPLLLWLSYWVYKRLTRKTALKAAKKQLLQLKQNTEIDNGHKLQAFSVLIRRTVISQSGRNENASLTGEDWLAFLDRSVKGFPFTQGIGRLLAEAPYRQYSPSDSELSALIQLCEQWLKAQSKRRKP